MRRETVAWLIGVTVLAFPSCLGAAPAKVTFSESAQSVEVYDYLEVTAAVDQPDAANPFVDVEFTGSFGQEGQGELKVDGFCDSIRGDVFRIRLMPATAGDYQFSVTFRQGQFEQTHRGSFRAVAGHRKGPIRVDPKYPWHFVWEGTGEHYYFNGTTAFWLMGWREERVIRTSIERLQRLKINRLRVLLSGAANIFWGEPVMTGENFTLFLRPWVAEAPESFDRPGLDFTRFNVAYWQKWDRMLRFARERDMIISAILDISTHSAHPAAGSEDERRYLRYAAARLTAFSNITWDLGDDLDSFRDETWARATGTLLVRLDPYKHLATSHPINREHQDRASDWFGFTSIQDWSRAQHALMLDERRIQKRTGRIIPQTNEEYGYEDHYPHWAPKPDGDSAETLRHMAWEIAMAGAYGCAGESARRGVNIWPDTGGGWINGRGDDTMVMLRAETRLPIQWSATNNIAWKTPLPGEGWSSPIVWNERVFVTTATEGGASCRVISVDRTTGKLVWDKEVFRQLPGHKQQRNGYATSTPCTDGERVYAVFGDGSFVAIDFEGNISWANRDFPFYGEHGLGTSPILWQELLIMTRDGSGRPPDSGAGWHSGWDQARVLALDKSTGKLRWEGKRGLSRIAHVVPNVWTAPDGRAELVSGAGDVVQGFTLETGERLWSSKNVGEGVVPSIVIGDGLTFTASGWGGRESIKAFRLGSRGDLGESNLVWEQRKGAAKIPSYLFLKPYLFVINEGGIASCLQAETGEIVWQERIGGNFSASPVSAEGRIYLLSDEGETTVIEAKPEFSVIARNALGEKCQASMAISRGKILIRTASNLFCIQ